LKWPPQNGPLIPEEQQDLHYPPAARLNEKGCLPVWGGDALSLQVWFIDVYHTGVMPQVRSDQFLIYSGTNQVVYAVFFKFSPNKNSKKIVIGNICGIVVN
jgi:hypothetical protein